MDKKRGSNNRGTVEEKYTFCRVCEASCGMVAIVRDGVIEKLHPNRDHAGSGGWACRKGLSFHELDGSPDRLLTPMKRTGSTWEPLGWDRALMEIGGKVREIRKRCGPDAIAAYAGNGSGFNLPHAFGLQGFMNGIGSKSIYSASSQDCSNKFLVAELMYGSPVIQTLPDFDRSQCLIIVGANPSASKLSFAGAPRVMRRLKDAEASGCRIFHINPRRTETAAATGRHIFIRPGTDVFFLLALASELIRAGCVDHEAVRRHMKNFEALRNVVLPWTPERAASVTGMAPEVIRELALVYRESAPSILYCSTGINHGPDPSLSFWIIEAVNAISGNLDREGGTLVGRGIIDLPKMTMKSGALRSTHRSRVGGFRAVMDCLPGAVLHDEILTPGDGQVKALFVSGGNPLLSFPDSRRMEEALESLELLVSVDIFRNETGNCAHYLLPATSFLQHPDINFVFQSMMGIMNPPVLNYSDAMRPPEEDQRDEFRIYRDLTRAAGLRFFGSWVVSVLVGAEGHLRRLPVVGRLFELTQKRIFGMILRFAAGLSLRKARKHPHGFHLEPLKEKNFLGRRVLTGDGKVDLAPAPLVDAASRLEARYREELDSRGSIRLINMRESLSHNSYYHNAPSCVGGERWTNYLYMNRSDAEAAGLLERGIGGGAVQDRQRQGPGGDNGRPDAGCGRVTPWMGSRKSRGSPCGAGSSGCECELSHAVGTRRRRSPVRHGAPDCD